LNRFPLEPRCSIAINEEMKAKVDSLLERLILKVQCIGVFPDISARSAFSKKRGIRWNAITTARLVEKTLR
jgi:hypothetical protein